jgi:hypothetical protein
MSIISATHEKEIQRIVVRSHSGQKVIETLISFNKPGMVAQYIIPAI